MTRRALLVAACMLLVPVTFAQEKASDPVTGTWGRNNLPYLDLKFDGKSKVSGTAIWRSGDGGYEDRSTIQTGTFDPRTGAIKLEGEATRPDGAIAKYVIEGKIDGNTVSGTFKFGERSGQFSFTRL